MNEARKMGLFLVMLGAFAALWYGLDLHRTNRAGAIDFKELYFPTRTLIHHSDPYNSADVLCEYQPEPTSRLDDQLVRTAATHDPYPPTSFLVLAPLASMPFSIAWACWTVINLGGLIFGTFLIWDLGAVYSPKLSGALVAFLLINAESLIASGNDACLAIGLCCAAVWSVFRGRWGVLGAVCLAVSILLKPQDGGLVWLYLLAAGKTYRLRALQTLVFAIALGVPSVVWTFWTAPNWPQEVASNLSLHTATGGLNDPGPTSGATPGSMVNLQVVFSLFRNDARFYNLATFLVCGALIAAVLVLAARREQTQPCLLLGLASISALAILVVYHRRYETKLLALAVPACAMLWARRNRLSNVALVITGLGIALSGDGTWVFVSNLIEGLRLHHAQVFFLLQKFLVTLPAPLALLTVGVFYLWTFRSCARVERPVDDLSKL